MQKEYFIEFLFNSFKFNKLKRKYCFLLKFFTTNFGMKIIQPWHPLNS